MTRPNRRLFLFSLTGAALLSVVAGCGGSPAANPSSTGTGTPAGDAPATTGAGAATVTAGANDFSFKFSQSAVRAGTAHFVLQNDSKTYQHELWVYPQNQPRLGDYLRAEDDGRTVNAQDYLQSVAGHVGPVDPGKSASFDAQLQPGTYEMSCLVASTIAGKTMVHYEMGMHGLLTVN